MIFVKIIFFVLYVLDQFFHVAGIYFGFFSSAGRAEGVGVCFNLKQPQFVLLDRLLEKRGRYFFRFDKDFSGIFFFLCHLDSQFF